MITYGANLNVVKMDCMVVVCNLLQILLILVLEGIDGYHVRFVIPPSCRSGFVLMDPEDKLILQLSLVHSSYSAGITVSNGCHHKSDPGGCVVRGTVSIPGVYRVRPNDAGNVGCYKKFNVTEGPPEYVVTMTTNRSDISTVTKGYPNVEVNTAVTEQSERVQNTTETTNSSDTAMVTTEVYTKVTERDNDNQQNSIIAIVLAVVAVVLVAVIIAVASFVFIRKFKRTRRPTLPEGPPEYVVTMTTNRSDISTVTKGYPNVEVNTAVTEQSERVQNTTETTNSSDTAMVTTEVYTKVTERDNDNQQNSIIAIVLAVVAVVLVAVIIAVASFVFIRKFKRTRRPTLPEVQTEDPPTTNTLYSQVYDPGDDSIYAEIDESCMLSDEALAYDYVTNNDLQTKPTTSAYYITPVSCNDKDLKTQATSSDECYLMPLNKRNPVYEAIGDNTPDEYTTLDRQNMNMYEHRKMLHKQHF